MTGMFQSSRIASGNSRLQTSSACSPSSASTIWKSISSRMRLAMFRMTLESSTTRQVFISALLSRRALRLQFGSGRQRRLRHDFKHAVDVEDDHELSVEPVDTAGELGHAGVEDAVNARQDQADRLARDRHAVTEFAQQRLAGMRQRFETRQSQKAASTLDRVGEAKDVIQNLGVVRVLLEPHQLIVDRVQALARLGQKLPQ